MLFHYLLHCMGSFNLFNLSCLVRLQLAATVGKYIFLIFLMAAFAGLSKHVVRYDDIMTMLLAPSFHFVNGHHSLVHFIFSCSLVIFPFCALFYFKSFLRWLALNNAKSLDDTTWVNLLMVWKMLIMESLYNYGVITWPSSNVKRNIDGYQDLEKSLLVKLSW